MGCMADIGEASFCGQCGRARDLAAESPLHLPPRTILCDQYVIGRVLGHGGFGVTYLGWDLNLARKVAIKEYLPHGIATRTTGESTVIPCSGPNQGYFEWGLDKFLEEARVVARFQNYAGIVAVLNFFRAHGTAYLVMEYLDGRTLHEYLARKGGKIAFDWAVRIMMPVMDALREVHKVGILHRDVSPDNVFLTNSGQVKVLDFGAARYALGEQSRNLSVILKEGFAPEEQYRTKGNQGPWTDVYAVAATLYRAITGTVPQPALDRLETDELAPPSQLGVLIAPEREAVLMKALSIRAAGRYQTIDEFQKALTNGDAAAGVASPPQPTKTMAQPQAEPAAASAVRTIEPPRIATAAAPPPPLPVRPAAVPPPLPGARTKKRRYGVLAAKIAAVVLVIAAGAVSVFMAVRMAQQRAVAPVIHVFAAQPEKVTAGQNALLNWTIDNARDVLLEPGDVVVASYGGRSVSPAQTTTYTLTARNAYGNVSRTITVTVDAPPETAAVTPPPITTQPETPPDQPEQKARPEEKRPEQQDRPEQKSLPRAQKSTPAPATATQAAQPTLAPPGPPPQDHAAPQPASVAANAIQLFRADPPVIRRGQSTMLAWSVRDATYVSISGLGRVNAEGHIRVSPTSDMQYLLIAVNAAGHQETATADVKVNATLQESYSRANAPDTTAPAAIENGPQQTSTPSMFSAYVVHDHGGNGGLRGAVGRIPYLGKSAANECSGRMLITATHVIYDGSYAGHRFNVPISDIVEVRVNPLPVRGSKAFYIRFRNGATFMFIPRTSTAELIVSAISRIRK